MVNRKMRRELNLDEFEAQAFDAIGQTPGVTLKLNNGETVTIPHPMLVDDDRQAEIDAAQADDYDGDESQTIRFARAVLGPEEHAKFLAGGGKSNHVTLAWAMLTKEAEAKGPKLPR